MVNPQMADSPSMIYSPRNQSEETTLQLRVETFTHRFQQLLAEPQVVVKGREGHSLQTHHDDLEEVVLIKQNS